MNLLAPLIPLPISRSCPSVGVAFPSSTTPSYPGFLLTACFSQTTFFLSRVGSWDAWLECQLCGKVFSKTSTLLPGSTRSS